MTDTDTDAGPTPGPWHYQEDSDNYTHIVRSGERFVVQLPQDSSGAMEANARLIATAGTAAHELPDEYDPVAAVEALPDILDVCEFPENDAFDLPRYFGHVARQLPEGDHNREMMEMLANRLSNALQKARRDDE